MYGIQKSNCYLFELFAPTHMGHPAFLLGENNHI